MLIKMTKYSTGVARDAANYIAREGRFEKLDSDEEIIHLRGDIEMIATIADSLSFKHTYNSSVIAFHLEDKPTDEQIQSLLDDYEKACFGNLDPNRFAQAFVGHKHHGSIHIHVLTARVDLQTGKSFNPAPPSWQFTFSPMIKAHNYVNGWVRPDDPVHKRNISRGHEHLIESNAIKNNLEKRDQPKKLIGQYIQSRVMNGLIENYEDVVKSLGELGDINRQGKSHITVVIDDVKYRMQGVYFEKRFVASQVENTEENRVRQSRADRIDTKLSKYFERIFDKRVEAKSAFNITKYGADAGILAQDASYNSDEDGFDSLGCIQSNFSLVLGSSTHSRQNYNTSKMRGDKNQKSKLPAMSDKAVDPKRRLQLLFDRIKEGAYEQFRQSAYSVIETAERFSSGGNRVLESVCNRIGLQIKSIERFNENIKRRNRQVAEINQNITDFLSSEYGVSELEKLVEEQSYGNNFELRQ